MTRPATDVDVVVIGGGILGMCVAMIAARASADVVVCRLSDARVPHADTLRNQSWLQSGLRYVGDADMHDRLLFAKRMRAARQLLHDELGFALPGGFGVFRMRDEADAADLERKAALLGVAVHRLRPEDAFALVGSLFYEPDSPYYATPEVPFDEAAILDELRARAGHGVHELVDPVALVPDAAAPGFVITVGGAALRPGSAVLAAGAGNVPLLAQLGVAAALCIDRTPLVVIRDAGSIPRTRVYVDRVRKLSVVTHPRSAVVRLGTMVIGVDGFTAEDVEFAAPGERRLVPEVEDALWRRLPRRLAIFRDRSRITAGFEVRHATSSSTSVPWISDPFPGFPGLVAAIPGRATLSMSVAHDVAARLALEPRAGPPPAARTLGAPWRAPIYMHHEPYYDHLDDC